MLCTRSVCLRKMAQGRWSAEMQYWRLINNPQVTISDLIEGWSKQTRTAVKGRHVLALQDTSEIQFSTTPGHRRGLGKIAKGNAHGVLLHAMIAVDATSGFRPGLVGGQVWTRQGTAETPHGERALADKELARWLTTAEQGKDVLAEADMITVIDDREGDFYAHWALTPGDNVHHLTRAMHDRALVGGTTLYKAIERTAFCDKAVIDLTQRMDRRGRQAHLSLRFGTVALKRPTRTGVAGLPESVTVSFVDVIEQHPPKAPARPSATFDHARGSQPRGRLANRLLVQAALAIEQFFRSMKKEGLKIEDSQLETAEGLIKLVAIAAKAACTVIQLVQARNGGEELPAEFVFSAEEIEVLRAINNKTYKATTKLQTNHHRPNTLAWAAWIIARLGGWSGYATHRPPGPITFHTGLARFQNFTQGWALANV